MTGIETTPSVIYPSFYYDDAAAMIDWLCKAFGFRRRLVVPRPDGTVMHSELTFGDAVIMVGTSKPELLWVSPQRLTGINSLCSFYVADPDPHYALAVAAGAEVLRELRDEEYGGRGYMVRDPEGNQWYFGSYRPGAHWTQ